MAPSTAVPAHATTPQNLVKRNVEPSTRDESTVDADLPTFTPDTVALHNKPDDCWMIIEHKVYDVTPWVPKHPGGAMIYVNAGRDCTQLFESYHPLYVRKMLGKFLVGTLAPQSAPKDSTLAPLVFSPETGFYTTLKRRVEAYFKEKKINPRVHSQLFLKAALILSGYFLSFYGTFLAPWGFWYAAICAVVLGVCTAEIGVSIQHDCNHGAFSASPVLGYILGLSLDLAGASSFMWKQQHVVGHHVHTNVTGFDPDIRVKDPDVRRVTLLQPRRWYHAYQHLYLMILYGLLGIKSVLIDDFSAYSSGTIGPVKLAQMTGSEEVIFWGSKGLYALYTFGLPLFVGHRSLLQFLTLYGISQVILGWMLAFMFQVAHVVPEAQFPEASLKGPDGAPSVSWSWAEMQVATSTNFCAGSVFWTHFSGGLNHQIEHHLFPGVCHMYYPSIQPIVESTCLEFHVPYHCYSSYWEALGAHIKHLHNVGISSVLSTPLG